jgi:hypothetical protein
MLNPGYSDLFGNASTQPLELDLFAFAGDANHDRAVNLQDFNILASNFGQSDRTFSQGDFNYDGTVNLADFNILASHVGQVLGTGGRIVRRPEFGQIPIRPSARLNDRTLAALLAAFV